MAVIKTERTINKYYILCTSYMIQLVVQTKAFEGWMSIDGDRLLGGEAYIVCSYVTKTNEGVINFQICPLPAEKDGYFYYIDVTGIAHEGVKHHQRISLQVNVTGTPGRADASMTARMKISRLDCHDEGHYGCSFEISAIGQVVKTYKTSSMLVVRAPPSPPLLKLQTPSVHPIEEDEVWLYEGSVIRVECSANSGRPGFGLLEWKLHRNEIPISPLRNKRRIVIRSLIREQNTIGGINCTERVMQVLTMQVNMEDQNLVIACFVHNYDFPRPQTPTICTNRTGDLCVASESIWILSRGNRKAQLKSLSDAFMILVSGILAAVIVEIVILPYLCRSSPCQRENETSEESSSSTSEEAPTGTDVADQSTAMT